MVAADERHTEGLGGGDDDPVGRIGVLGAGHLTDPVRHLGSDGHDFERRRIECELRQDRLAVVLREGVPRLPTA